MVAIKTIGEVLKDKRTELGLGLSEAEKLTNIPKLYIIALETGIIRLYPVIFILKLILNNMQKSWILMQIKSCLHMRRMDQCLLKNTKTSKKLIDL